MKKEINFKETLQACKDFNFNLDITAEMCWNEGYNLGRQRWTWGPRWLSSFKGWIRSPRRWLKWNVKKAPFQPPPPSATSDPQT